MEGISELFKLVITGACGHIGSKLIRNLDFNKFNEILLIDNFASQRYASLFNLPKDGKFKFVEADILKSDLNALFKDAAIVVHLAALTNAAGSFEIQNETELVNFEGTKLVADACLNSNSKMIFLSTTSVYGTQSDVVDENCAIDDLKPQSPYADAKLKSEQFLKEFAAQNSVFKFVVLRFGTIAGYSIGMRFHTAVNKFCWQAVMNEPLTVWSTAYEQVRPYLSLTDGVNALNFVIEKELFDNSIYNVLTDNLSVKDIVSKIKKYIKDVKINFVDSKIMNQLSYDVSSKKFIDAGFAYSANLDSEIFETLKNLVHSNGITIEKKGSA
jgi:nucleoside-diphosphate-sugar epimerase